MKKHHFSVKFFRHRDLVGFSLTENNRMTGTTDFGCLFQPFKEGRAPLFFTLEILIFVVCGQSMHKVRDTCFITRKGDFVWVVIRLTK